ncbi:hypothetical protein TIFTF001_038784 [Ficus carica]|uniref:Uncharacterized protein n=1 Tax=Ficus carica TaxID=3494 RepID=A0AA88E7W9_FICCA|nr:hypothetical protein TIFTF001_038784 [Ficus carica]
MTSKLYDPLSQLPDHKLIIVLEFVGTCASKDSASVLVQARVDQSPDSNWETKWKALSEKSGTEIAGCLNREKTFGVIGEKMASGGEYKYEKLRTIFEDIAILEKEAITRVERSRLLRNLSSENLKAAALKMELRSEKNVHSNELAFDEVSVTTGDIERQVESALDKLELFREEIRKITKGNHTTVFIGSNMLDLLCLVEADIGLVISPSPILTGMAKHFGVSLLPLITDSVKRKRQLKGLQLWEKKPGVIYTVSCWAEIQAFILGR